MATDEHYTDVSVTLKGQTVKVQVSKELMDHYTSTDPDAKLLAQNLIIQAAMEKTALIPEEPDSNELPDIPPSNTASVVTMVSSASSTGTSTSSGTGWPEKAEKCLLDFFGELDKAPVKNKWLKVSEKMKDIGYNYTSEQCRLKIKALKERHQRISKKRGKSGEGGVEDVLEDKMSETFSTPDCKPVYISESVHELFFYAKTMLMPIQVVMKNYLDPVIKVQKE